jgi:hypothetical protein
VLTAGLLLAAPPARAVPVEGYAPYQPQKHCNPKAKPGTKMLATWLVNRHGGGRGPISRACGSGGTSEHKEGRAFDWLLDATRKADRRKARAVLDKLFATRKGGEHALARRMGIMYVIWDDRTWASYRRFERKDYLSSSCRSVKSCSKTLRHRDHMHISLSRKGGRGDTSWYLARR